MLLGGPERGFPESGHPRLSLPILVPAQAGIQFHKMGWTGGPDAEHFFVTWQLSTQWNLRQSRARQTLASPCEHKASHCANSWTYRTHVCETNRGSTALLLR